MGLRGNLSSISGLKQRLRAMPITVAHRVAATAAPAMTSMTRTAFDTNRTVYGAPRPTGVDGASLTLEESGATKRTLQFSATGTVLRCVLGPPWAKYLIGKYDILPNGGMPADWTQKLVAIVRDEAPAALRGSP
jgi:hypothetical protein